jgi:flagellar biosynthesis/type III secretory pathway chaperone
METITENEITAKMKMMQQIVSSFYEVINKENKALEEGDIVSVKSLYEQKLKTVSAYRTMSAFFIKNREAISQYNSPLKEELKEYSSQLDKSLKRNEMLLKARMEAGKSVMDVFINIAKTTNASQASSYGAKGFYSPLDNSRNALAFNRTL